MFKLIKRMVKVVEGFFNEQVRDMEWNQPEAVLEKALERKKENLEKFYNAVAELQALCKRDAKMLASSQINLERLERQIIQAARSNDEENGVALMMKKQHLEKMIQEDTRQLTIKNNELAVAKKQLMQAQQEVKTFESSRLSLIGEIKMLQAQKDIKEINTKFFNNTDMQAYNDLIRKVEMEKNKASLIDEINGIDEAYPDNSDWLDAKQEFEQLSVSRLTYKQAQAS